MSSAADILPFASPVRVRQDRDIRRGLRFLESEPSPTATSGIDPALVSNRLPGRSQAFTGASGARELLNRDPVLVSLAPAANLSYSDERVFATMEREHKIKDARRHLESEIFSFGWAVQEGRSGSPGAQRLREFAETLWERLPGKETILKRLHDATYYGWRPLQVIVDTEARAQNRAVWLPSSIIDKDPWRVRYLEDGGLIFKPGFSSTPVVFTPEEAVIGWLCPRVGTLDTPYGRGLLSDAFILWFAKQKMWERFHRGSERALGMVKVKADTDETGEDLGKSIAAIRSQVQDLMAFLNDQNVLLETGDWTVDFLDSPATITGGISSLVHLDEAIMTLFCGEILTSNPGDRGTQALGSVQRDVKSEYAREASRESVEAPMTDLFRRYIRINFGDVDEEDLPSFVNLAAEQLDPAAVSQLFAMGAPIDATVTAERWGARDVLVDEDTPEDHVVVQQATTAADPFGGIPDFLGVSPVDEPRQSFRVQSAEDEEERIESQLGASMRRSAGPLDRYLEALGRDRLERAGIRDGPDPEAEAAPE